MTSVETGPSSSRSAWRRYLTRGWAAILVCTLLGVGAGIAYTALAHKRYTAVTRVLVTATGLDNAAQSTNSRTPNSTINLDTEAQLVTSTSVVDGAVSLYRALALQTYDDIVKNIAVTVPPNTTVLQIAFTADTARGAQAVANALATAYLNDRKSTAQQDLSRRITAAQNRVNDLTTKLQTLSTNTANASKNFVQTQIAIVKSEITGLNDQLLALNNIQITPGRVVTAAVLPTSPSSPNLVVDLASGIALGLLLGLFVAWLRVRYRRRVRTADDLEQVLDAPCLASLTSADQSAPSATGAYRRIALVALAAVKEPARLVVSSPEVSPSATQVAAGIATSLSHSGTPTALLQIHGPEIEAAFPRSVSSLRVNTADDLVMDSGESMGQAVDRVRGRNSVIVVDVPGAALTADAQTVASHADAVVLVIDRGVRSRTVRAALAEFDSVGAPVLGGVLIMEPAESVIPPDETESDPLKQPWASDGSSATGSKRANRRRRKRDAQGAAVEDDTVDTRKSTHAEQRSR